MTGIEILYVLGSVASIASLIKQSLAVTPDGEVEFEGNIDEIMRRGDRAGKSLSHDKSALIAMKGLEEDPFVKECIEQIKKIRKKMAYLLNSRPDLAPDIANEGSKKVCEVLKAIKRVKGNQLPQELQILWDANGCFDFS
jgi:hypothetical protein